MEDPFDKFEHLFPRVVRRSGAGDVDNGVDFLDAIGVDIEIARVVVRDRGHRIFEFLERLVRDGGFEVGDEDVAIGRRGRIDQCERSGE